MKEHKSPLLSGLETFLKFATPIGAVIAFLIGIYHYRATEETKFEQASGKKDITHIKNSMTLLAKSQAPQIPCPPYTCTGNFGSNIGGPVPSWQTITS
jgi:hypothetical protein